MILDGWGESLEHDFNGVYLADPKVWKGLVRDNPSVLLKTDGESVGLPEGQMGNSEVGHMTIGAGRVIWQDLPRISEALASEKLDQKWLEFCQKMKNSRSDRVHMLGLLSDGGVHSHSSHLVALTKRLLEAKLQPVWHIITDGRDTVRGETPEHVKKILGEFKEGEVEAASVMGRFYGMDRDNRIERTRLAYEAIMFARGIPWSKNLIKELENCRESEGWGVLGGSEEMLLPRVIGEYDGVKNGDGLICFNFRTDRARQILRALLFGIDNSGGAVEWGATAGMVEYAEDISQRMVSLFERQVVVSTLGEVVSKAGGKQLRVAETEKYAHVTYFLNGGVEKAWENEDRIIIPSPQVKSYDEYPRMSAFAVTDAVKQSMLEQKHDLIVVNFANPDMLGHTGNLDAVVEGVKYVDKCLGEINDLSEKSGYYLLILADHGNAEEMLDKKSSKVSTTHSLNPVRCVCKGCGVKLSDKVNAASSIMGLADVAPSVLNIMGVNIPFEMNGKSLFVVKGDVQS